jgi:hypothetical protein
VPEGYFCSCNINILAGRLVIAQIVWVEFASWNGNGFRIPAPAPDSLCLSALKNLNRDPERETGAVHVPVQGIKHLPHLMSSYAASLLARKSR